LIPEKLKRALSIRQPLIEAILTGEKTWEFRSWATKIRERVYLYASKKAIRETVYGFTHTDSLALPRGLVVGSVEIIGCMDDEEGGFGWELASPVRYPKPWVAHGVPQPAFWHPTF
jgi:hypothetical protein